MRCALNTPRVRPSMPSFVRSTRARTRARYIAIQRGLSFDGDASLQLSSEGEVNR